jgi:hypothetical protein
LAGTLSGSSSSADIGVQALSGQRLDTRQEIVHVFA